MTVPLVESLAREEVMVMTLAENLYGGGRLCKAYGVRVCSRLAGQCGGLCGFDVCYANDYHLVFHLLIGQFSSAQLIYIRNFASFLQESHTKLYNIEPLMIL